MGCSNSQSYGVGMEKRRLGDRLAGLTLSMFNPLLWLIDVTLQKRWPLTDPRPPRGIGLGRRVVWEGRQLMQDVVVVVTGLVVIVSLGFVAVLLVLGLIEALGVSGG
jgi:hypothetical protein